MNRTLCGMDKLCLKNVSDEELYTLVKCDDERAYAELYERFKLPLLRYTSKKVSMEDAEDIVHDLLTKLWYNRSAIMLQGHFNSYLYCALRNRIIDHLTRNSHSKQYATSITSFPTNYQSSEGADHRVREKSFLDNMEVVLNRYGSRAFSIVNLKIQGYNHHEIAEKLDLSEKTIRNQQSVIIKYLRNKMRDSAAELG